ILVNAAYFKGEWSTPFEKRETSPGDFTLLDGTKKPLPMMLRAEEETDYHRGEGYQAVHLPYGNGRIGMIVMLPDQDSSLDALCEAVDAEEWGRCVRGMHETECTLKLPRFSAEYATSLKTDLTRLGMEIAFDPVRADFAAMQPARPRRWIHDVLHSTYLKVDEKGTEAAAATEVLMSDGEDPGGPRAVLVDRPFICAIRDTNTGAILFIGAIVDPGEA
ncbi:MAG TPA: serpin family protein, partial [Armatimonadota bacterium]|nr:serpin family protein [Armatimonadota bacterium]